MEIDAVSNMKVDELKNYLRVRGLKCSGKKEELVARIVAAKNNVKPRKLSSKLVMGENKKSSGTRTSGITIKEEPIDEFEACKSAATSRQQQFGGGDINRVSPKIEHKHVHVKTTLNTSSLMVENQQGDLWRRERSIFMKPTAKRSLLMKQKKESNIFNNRDLYPMKSQHCKHDAISTHGDSYLMNNDLAHAIKETEVIRIKQELVNEDCNAIWPVLPYPDLYNNYYKIKSNETDGVR